LVKSENLKSKGLSPASAGGAPLSMLTFSPMIDSELCRLILTRYERPFQEEWHLFGWVSVLTLFRAGTVQIPVVFGEGAPLVGPRGLVDRLDKNCRPERSLMPVDTTLRAQVEQDWNDGDALSYATRTLAYYYLLPHREIMIEPFTRGVPPPEAWFVENAYPVFAGLFQVLLWLTAAHARDALKQLRIILDQVDSKIGGRRFLVGSQLTVADLSLAAALAPLLLPEGYRGPIPSFDKMPADLRNIITEVRQHETARFAERIYRDYQND
jgi:glutathione S-transferase